MGDISLLTPPVNTQVVTLVQAKDALGITTAAQDTLLTRLIVTASEEVSNYMRRPLWRAQYEESLPGSDLRNLVLSRYPIVSIDSATEAGSAITLTSILFVSRLAGIIDYASGWSKSGEPDRYVIQYTAGYFMPADDYVGSISVAASDNSMNSAGAEFTPLLRAGDIIYGSGFTDPANNGRHLISSATTSKLIMSATSSLIDEGAASRTLGLRTLPSVVEDAGIELVRQDLRRSMTDPNDPPDWHNLRLSAMAPLSAMREVFP